MKKEVLREVARELKSTWSDEQFEAHWLEFEKLRIAVTRGRRKQLKKLL